MMERKKNKVLLISLNNLYATPYLHSYIFEKEHIEYHLFYWNRDNIEEEYSKIRLIPLNLQESKTKSKFLNKIKTVINYMKFSRNLKRHLKTNNYDKIIFLNNVPAVLISRTLIKKHAYKYIIDIRDFTLENIKMFYKIQNKVINKSNFTVISSDAYKEFLPSSEKYFISHNYTSLENYIDNFEKNKGKIVISNIGYIRFMEQNRKLLKEFANDDRFEIRFIGKGSMQLQDFIDENKIKNVILLDRFDPSETVKHFSEANIINNVYGNDNKYLDFALSNKLYYAAQLKKPILVSERTYMEKISKKYNFGISYKTETNNVADFVYEQYIQLDNNLLNIGANNFLKIVEKENEITSKRIKEFLNS